MQQFHPAEFHGTPLSILDHAGQKWLTAEQVGLCLGYNEANASQGIRNLYNRHADEFTEADTCQLKLIWQGQTREMRVFSHTGCNLLAFFSNTYRAKEFRAWAKLVLARHLAGQPAPAAAPRQGGKAIVITRRLERLALERFVAGEPLKAIGQALGISRPAVHLLVTAKYRFSPAAGAPECSAELIAAVARRHLEVERQRLLEAQERAAQRLLAHGHNHALADALDEAGQQLLQAAVPAALLHGEG